MAFKDDHGAEFQVGVLTRAQRTGMANDEPYIYFHEDMIDTQAKDGPDPWVE